jgi:hypothetical protein
MPRNARLLKLANQLLCAASNLATILSISLSENARAFRHGRGR